MTERAFGVKIGCDGGGGTDSLDGLVAMRIVVCPCFLSLHYRVQKIQQQQPFNSLFSRTSRVSRYQKGKTNLDFTGARDSEWQWHQLGHMHPAETAEKSLLPSKNRHYVSD